MKSVYIAPIGAVTALGNLEQTWQGLLQGRTGIEDLNGKIADLRGTPVPVAAVDGIDATAYGRERLDHLLSILLNEIMSLLPLPENTGLVLATTKGAVDEILDMEDGADVSKLELQPWDIASHLTGILGLDGPVTTVSAACASGSVAVIQAAMRILDGHAKHMVVIGVDVLSRFVISGFHALQALSRSLCRPFDRHRDGLVLGEGAAALLLSSNSGLVKEVGHAAAISGWGISCDAVHITAPARDARGLVSALENVLRMAGRSNAGGINAHGTGTVYNDAMEIEAFRRVFGDIPPFHSVKGAIGHCLGAAGVIEASVSLRSVEAGLLPPTAGLIEPENQHVNADGQRSIRLDEPSVISCNSGFGGINAAVMFDEICLRSC